MSEVDKPWRTRTSTSIKYLLLSQDLQYGSQMLHVLGPRFAVDKDIILLNNHEIIKNKKGSQYLIHDSNECRRGIAEKRVRPFILKVFAASSILRKILSPTTKHFLQVRLSRSSRLLFEEGLKEKYTPIISTLMES